MASTLARGAEEAMACQPLGLVRTADPVERARQCNNSALSHDAAIGGFRCMSEAIGFGRSGIRAEPLAEERALVRPRVSINWP